MTLFFSDLHVSQSELFQDLSLGLPHARFFFRLGMIVTEQVQDAMDDQKLDFGFKRMPGGVCLGLGARDEMRISPI
jgi:hypothetical protein